MEEEWKDIPGFEGMYQISNFGRVKSLARKMKHQIHGTWLIKERILKPGLAGQKGDQYQIVFLHEGGGKQRIFRIHRLVAENFIPKIPGKDFVNHIDCKRMNNRVDNLEWVTPKENAVHARDHGRFEKAKLRRRAILNIDTGERFDSLTEACEKYGVTKRAIYQSAISMSRKCRGYRWKYADE